MKTRLILSTALVSGLAPAAFAQELTILSDSSPDTVATFEALTAAYTAQNPDVSFSIETRPGGSEGDNLVKTRLATGEMADLFIYNSGSLLQALRPDRTLLPIDDIENYGQINEAYLSTVQGADGATYGVPLETAQGGGIYYHKPSYEELGLEIPMTWDQFMANNAAISDQTDKAPIAQSYRDTWTSQLFVLADFYNVLQAVPDFPEKFTANEAKFANTPAAAKGFERLQEAFEAGYFNADFGAATYDDGLRMVATGEAVHYPMLTFAVGAFQQNHPDLMEDVGFFAQPGDDLEANGLTVWMPASLYSPRDTEHPEIVRDFMNFVASPAGCDAITEAIGVTGPYLIEGCELPAEVPGMVADMMPYFDEEGRTAPALEFLSPVKGPSLEQITVEVGSGIRDAASAAALYDQDVEKLARQLGLPGW
ncbi:raffinose/stachyose/melibiose transport system substrate-binding protein [Limimaricola variabilis]|uniref:Raffinose/stachyose/melibiose transport system substrate-binding protein n=1 Tax=Limimaricola variabilis TaxID=1492771 RepID=A0ABR6HSY8_9RHOB|nr:extracellular solute-binding protein [Limimaricola variabilis]MBB3713540.1 raffinose/stachyose/melibiose transport system substrate-binding protein [Limimaricola variabilis]